MPYRLSLEAPNAAEPPPSKGSRFIGHIAPVQNAEEAMAFVATMRSRYPDATHHCYAWRTETGDRGWRASDDGEPSGTAGRPILARIDGAGLVGVVAVVVRYYGGTKLGKGGLIRAYGGAAAAAIDGASIVSVRETRALVFTIAYGDQGAVQSVLRQFELEPRQEQFDADVTLVIDVPTEEHDRLWLAISDRTGGRATLRSP